MQNDKSFTLVIDRNYIFIGQFLESSGYCTSTGEEVPKISKVNLEHCKQQIADYEEALEGEDLIPTMMFVPLPNEDSYLQLFRINPKADE